MGFWTITGHTYHSFADLPAEQVLQLINMLTREDIIEWLSWNDHNGIYDDANSLKEFGNIMSKEEGIEIMLRHIEESRPIEK